jgi:hypothetical protein
VDLVCICPSPAIVEDDGGVDGWVDDWNRFVVEGGGLGNGGGCSCSRERSRFVNEFS